MSSSPVITSSAVVEGPGFDFVEEDDVLFSLSLCREVHRIYGSYQDGSLQPDDRIWAGLSLTLEMLTALRGRVTEGMPALRLRVAAAQAGEMNTVLFGSNMTAGRALTRAQRLALASPAWTPALGQELGPALAPGSPWPSASPSGPSTRLAVAPRLRRFWARCSVATRLALGFFGCAVLGVLVDVPITIMALIPDDWVQLLLVFVLVPVVTRLGWRFNARTSPSQTAPAASWPLAG